MPAAQRITWTSTRHARFIALVAVLALAIGALRPLPSAGANGVVVTQVASAADAGVVDLNGDGSVDVAPFGAAARALAVGEQPRDGSDLRLFLPFHVSETALGAVHDGGSANVSMRVRRVSNLGTRQVLVDASAGGMSATRAGANRAATRLARFTPVEGRLAVDVSRVLRSMASPGTLVLRFRLDQPAPADGARTQVVIPLSETRDPVNRPLLSVSAPRRGGPVPTVPPSQPTTTSSKPPSGASPEALRTIDAPAVDREFPRDAVVNVRTEYGARGDGVTDDTAAIQAAISAGLGLGAADIPHKTLFFPKGTYLISRQLQWKLANGAWSTALTLQGENRDKTIIKLKDSAAGFTDAANPRAVVFTASDKAMDSNGSGQSAFTNFIFDLTVNVGQGNPGAVGIDYLANNRGAIRNVVVRAPAGSGQTGIAMNRPWPGPCLLKDVRVVGFGVGIQVTQPEFSITMENIDLMGQHTAGLSNTNDVVLVHNLTSTNTVPAVVNTNPRGLVTLVGASLVGGSSAHPAVDNRGTIYLRGLTSHGYRAALSERGVDVSGPSIGEYTTGPMHRLFSPISQRSLNLPIADPPVVGSGPPSGWASVATYGARSEPGGHDNTAAIQAALNSGHSTIYFPPGEYAIQHPLTVPSGVEILGFNSTLYARQGDFATPNPAFPLLRFTGTAGATTVVRQLFLLSTPGVTDIVDGSAGTLFLQDVQLLMNSSGYQNEPGAGPLFLEDVDGGIWNFANPQHVWARQLDAENPVGPQISNNGGTLWIFGLKTERPTTVLVTTNGGSSELLGGFLAPTSPIETFHAGTPAFVTIDSDVSLNYLAQTKPYPIQVKEIQNGITRKLLTAPTGAATLMPLYTG